MFTGLVQGIGLIRGVDTSAGGSRIEVEISSIDISNVQIGASVCCSGCCLSVVGKSETSLFFDVSRETLDKTIIGSWKEGARINVEPSLRLGDEMGGHIVSGHVDTTTKIANIAQDGDCWRVEIAIPNGFAHYIASKGSVAVDGISLTVNEVEQTHFGVNIIPHTWQNTSFSDRKVGDKVNIEVDMLARYVARMMDIEKGAK